MKCNNRYLTSAIIIISAILAFAVPGASAIPITGELGMGGSYKAVDAGWNPTTNALATGISFTPNQFIAVSATGSFAGTVSLFEQGTIKSFQFNETNIADFWTIDIFHFELTSVIKEATVDPDFLNLHGAGIITAAGFDATAGSWIFSGNKVSNVFTWSADTSAVTNIPEPDTLILFAIGSVGMLVTRRRFHS